MTQPDFKIGMTADVLDTVGNPMFGEKPLDLLRAAGHSWEFVQAENGMIPPAAIADFDALFIGGARVTEASLASDTGRLRIVARNGVGYDAVDLDALARRGILLTNSPDSVRTPVATTAVAFVLALSLRLPVKSRLPREGRWAERGDHTGIGLPGRTLGIVGLGGIGQELVRLMLPFGMRIIAADPFITTEHLGSKEVELLPLEAVMAQSDFLVIACLLNDSTRHLINAPRLALMKPTAFIVNVARGPIIDELALIAALRSGTLAGAGLDVFEAEPVDPANPLFAMDNVISTPHSLCWTDAFLEGVACSAIAGIVDVAERRLPPHIVNPDAISHNRVRRWIANGSSGDTNGPNAA